jgi:hypothetical protein
MTLPVRKLPATSGKLVNRERADMPPAARVKAGRNLPASGLAFRSYHRQARPAHMGAAMRLGSALEPDDLYGASEPTTSSSSCAYSAICEGARRAGVLTSITVRHGNRMSAGGRGGRSAHPVTAGVTGRRVAVQCTGQRLAAGMVPGRGRWAASGRGRAGQLGLPERTAPARSWGLFL